jgi:hypothetical protein
VDEFLAPVRKREQEEEERRRRALKEEQKRYQQEVQARNAKLREQEASLLK